MPEVGIRELKARASEIVRQVSENRARYVVNRRGKPVAVIVPVGSPESSEAKPAGDSKAALEELLRLGREAGKHWSSEKSAVDLLSEGRR